MYGLLSKISMPFLQVKIKPSKILLLANRWRNPTLPSSLLSIFIPAIASRHHPPVFLVQKVIMLQAVAWLTT
jgi:hypothetical protein